MATTVRQAKFYFSCLRPGKYFESQKYFESANIVLPTFFAGYRPVRIIITSLNNRS
jgi:hypothetical protein